MSYLLDTQILLWWLSESKQLRKKQREIISNPNNLIFVSVVSIWEIAIKKALNKLDAPDNLKEALEINNFQVLPMNIDHALFVSNLPQIHQDPFDRLLIAQCIIEDFAFIATDKIILRYNLTVV